MSNTLINAVQLDQLNWDRVMLTLAEALLYPQVSQQTQISKVKSLGITETMTGQRRTISHLTGFPKLIFSTMLCRKEQHYEKTNIAIELFSMSELTWSESSSGSGRGSSSGSGSVPGLGLLERRLPRLAPTPLPRTRYRYSNQSSSYYTL